MKRIARLDSLQRDEKVVVRKRGATIIFVSELLMAGKGRYERGSPGKRIPHCDGLIN